MKIVTILSLLLLASPAFGELTKADLHDLKEDLHKVIKEEITASEKRMKEYIDLKIDGVEKNLNTRIDGVEKNLNARIDGVDQKLSAQIDGLDKRMNNMWRLMMGLFGLVAATIAIPQIIIAYRTRDQKGLEQAMQSQIDQLRAQIESMQNTPS